MFKMYFGITIMNLIFALFSLLMPVDHHFKLTVIYAVIAAVFFVIALLNSRPQARW